MVGSVHVRDFNPSIGAYRWNWKFTAYPAHHIHRQNTHSKNVSRWKNQGKGKEKDALWREKVLAFCLEPTCNVWDANEPCHKCNQTWPKRKIRSYKARRIAPRETAKKGKGGHQCPTNTPFAPHKRKCCVHTSLWIAHNLVAHTAINTVDGTNAEHVSDKSGNSLHSCLPTLQSICRWAGKNALHTSHGKHKEVIIAVTPSFLKWKRRRERKTEKRGERKMAAAKLEEGIANQGLSTAKRREQEARPPGDKTWDKKWEKGGEKGRRLLGQSKQRPIFFAAKMPHRPASLCAADIQNRLQKNPQETFGSSSTPRGAPQKETNMWTRWLMEVAPQWLRNSRNKRHAERNEYERDQKETEWKGLINDEQKTEQKKHELMARSVQNMMPTDRSAGPSLPAPLSAPCRLSNLINRMRKRTITTHHSKTFNHFQTNLSTHLTSK